MRPVLIGLATLFALVLGLHAPASAIVLFEDNFNAEGPPGASIFNYTAFANWNVVGSPARAVDLINNFNPFGIFCAGGGGKCVDMDGTSALAGRIEHSISLGAGTYVLSFKASGNQRDQGRAPDTMSFGFGTFFDTITLNAFDPFATFTLSFTLLADTSGNIFFDAVGRDQLGIILDDVVLESRDIDEVPEPATFLLVGVGLVAAAAMKVRRRLRT